MTKEEAITLLNAIPESQHKLLTAINRKITIGAAIGIIKSGLHMYRDPLPHLIEKRVWQIVKNQRKPKFGINE